jgi:glycosyltransferase involved in cell wall biosynthesis
VSVIIVCYNQAQYFPDAIASALNQTYDNTEVIVIDDGSTDNTAAAAERFPQVRYFHQENRGLAAARNAGLQRSQGRYIIFLDADDRLLPRAVESGVECFCAFPDSGFVFGGYRNVDKDGFVSATERDPGITDDYYWHLLQGNFIGMHATVMYSREVIKSVEGFNIELSAAADYELYLRIARCWKVKQHGYLIAEYRKHDANMSGDRLFMLKSVLEVLHMERAHVSDRKNMRALRMGMNFYKHYYGNQLIDSWKKEMTVAGLLSLMRWYPMGLARHAANSLRKRTARS